MALWHFGTQILRNYAKLQKLDKDVFSLNFMLELNNLKPIFEIKEFLYKAVSCALVLITLSSCGDDPNRPLNRFERKYIDSVLINHQKEWQVYYDSTCVLKTDSMVRFYFDSLIQKEYEAIKKLEQ